VRAEFASRIVNEERQAACWQAATSDAAKRDALTAPCKGSITEPKDIAVEETWKVPESLGARVLPIGAPCYDTQRDLAACLAVDRALGVDWRNSDTMIGVRIMRAARECECDWTPLQEHLDGFPLVGWANENLPSGCRRAKVGGEDHPNVVICDVSAAEVEDLRSSAQRTDLQAFCNDRFGKDLVVGAPIRTVQVPGSCKAKAPFCSEFMGN
jgi:hypothetical protein